MTKLINEPTRLQAWLGALEHLLEVGVELNLVLSISSPLSDGPLGREALALLDRYYATEGEHPTHTIAETIFPGWQYLHRGVKGVYETYPNEEYPALRVQWGTYAHRMLRRKDAKGQVTNPLKVLIDKMKREASREGGFKACYELNLAHTSYDMPVYDTARDHKRVRGGPCLSHLSFTLYDGSVHLSALYRSHDYRLKVPGNLLGLARLQAFVANEVDRQVGSLVVYSTYAWYGQGKRKLQALTADIRHLLEDNA